MVLVWKKGKKQLASYIRQNCQTRNNFHMLHSYIKNNNLKFSSGPFIISKITSKFKVFLDLNQPVDTNKNGWSKPLLKYGKISQSTSSWGLIIQFLSSVLFLNKMYRIIVLHLRFYYTKNRKFLLKMLLSSTLRIKLVR